MAWLPAPERPDPAVVDMLQAEHEHLLGEWTAAKVAIALLVPLMFTALALALWRRSIGWALAVVNGAIVVKIAWTFWFGATPGALAHLTPALAGLAIVDLAILAASRRFTGRRSRAAERPAATPEAVA